MISVIVLTILGIIMGLVLAYASWFFAVKEDPKAKQIEESLPNVNCGGCGFTGCAGYAEAVSKGLAEPNLCRPGGIKVAEAIGKIMGKEVTAKEKTVSHRYCNGGRKEAKLKYDYLGIKTCRAANLIGSGYKQCVYSCLGFGDCSKVCPVNAITMNANGLPEINKEKCISCEKCVKECPRNILKMAPLKNNIHVCCSSLDPGKVVVKVCSVGCIACKSCEKACKFDAIHVNNNLAAIDYAKCTQCGACVLACPRKIIVDEKNNNQNL